MAFQVDFRQIAKSLANWPNRQKIFGEFWPNFGDWSNFGQNSPNRQIIWPNIFWRFGHLAKSPNSKKITKTSNFKKKKKCITRKKKTSEKRAMVYWIPFLYSLRQSNKHNWFDSQIIFILWVVFISRLFYINLMWLRKINKTGKKISFICIFSQKNVKSN